ncbi:MAG: MgtC/SapB family protein [Candidatus Paceibacterota bacterium]
MENSEIIIKLGLAILLGLVIGFERLLGHKEAGMKTHAMVSLGAALFVIISEILAVKYADIGGFDASRMASQIIVGIGFMGAGSIIFQGNRLKGLTTAGGFWVTAGIGMAAGFGLFNLAILTTVFVLLIFVVISMIERPVVSMIHQREKEEDHIQ